MRLRATALVSLVLLGCGASTRSPAVASEGDVAVGENACAMPSPDPGGQERSVLGTELAGCGTTLVTGYRRDGRCTTGPDDLGVHVVCAQVTDEFLAFTAGRGNDLTTPRGSFPGLHDGDHWCLCASRWAEAYEAGVAPPVVLAATHERALDHVPRRSLEAHARR